MLPNPLRKQELHAQQAMLVPAAQLPLCLATRARTARSVAYPRRWLAHRGHIAQEGSPLPETALRRPVARALLVLHQFQGSCAQPDMLAQVVPLPRSLAILATPARPEAVLSLLVPVPPASFARASSAVG